MTEELIRMKKNLDAYAARQGTRATLSIALTPIGLVPIPFLGAAAWAGRKATEKATEKATQGINKVQNETEREKTLSRYWSMKAFLIYLGLPATDDPLYAVFEPTRLKLKQIYGAKPEDDLCKMKPTAEQHEEIKKMRAENTVIDLEKLGLSLLQVLWHAYYCWDLLYWDTMTNGICKLAHANETKGRFAPVFCLVAVAPTARSNGCVQRSRVLGGSILFKSQRALRYEIKYPTAQGRTNI